MWVTSPWCKASVKVKIDQDGWGRKVEKIPHLLAYSFPPCKKSTCLAGANSPFLPGGEGDLRWSVSAMVRERERETHTHTARSSSVVLCIAFHYVVGKRENPGPKPAAVAMVRDLCAVASQ